MVFHKDQIPSSNDTLVCNKCKLPGHKQADCPSFDAQNKDCSSESDTESDESNTESIDDQPEESKNVATPRSTSTNTNTQEVSSVIGKASKKITKSTFSFDNKVNDILEEVENPKRKKKKSTKQREKTGDAKGKQSNIQTTMFQFSAGTPDSRNEKRPATTPTDEVHERSVPIQKQKGH
ncbi:Hypothetical predicted protein [Mytilus galloprovincialis]|uniref:CCHC-type domain-containing protein n=1 Tax=Mytilus galloprovincialis TaxID=29158 RepID=A0A8B6GG95_MYTGA|nr:Hypothetical predicted protein [Mytilus galloprovincialis]